MLLQAERELITRICARLRPDGLIVGTAGNISIRVDDLVAITPSGLPYEDLRPDLVSVVRYDDGTQVDGPLKPASELDLHLTTLRTTGLPAVVHTHAPACTTVASLEGITALPAIHYYVAMFGGPDIRVADYACYGTPELAANVARALEGRTAALMANHGVVAAGKDLDTAYTLTLELEWVCDQYLRALASGTPRILPDEEIFTVIEKIKTYGQQVPKA